MENLNLYQYPWYYGKINRQEAEQNLIDRGENEGCFLVRESQSQQGSWTLSVLDWIEGRCSVGHYLIGKNQNGRFYFDEEIAFDTIARLIDYYRENPENISFVLRDPCPREVRIPDKDVNDYDMYEIATELPVGEDFIPDRLLYTGTFGATWKGHMKSSKSIQVVAKIANEQEEARLALIHEANMLKCLNHENIVRFRGVISRSTHFHVILNYAGDVNLIGFLLNNTNMQLSLLNQLTVSTQIAAALEFCARMKCVHRNVKAKSVIINPKDLKCRLAAFKNSRAVDKHGFYHAATEDEKVDALHNSRIRWLSPEAARYGRFSEVSDVWSFAVLLVEIFTSGGLPYAGYLTCKVLEEVEDGFRCPKPQSCPKEIYDLLHQCWAPMENARPNFRSIKESLKKYVEDNREMLTKLQPPKSSEWNRYAPWKHTSVKQQRTTSMRAGAAVIARRNPSSPLPPAPYGYDN